MAFGLPDLTKLPDDVQPIVSDLFTRLNALEGKAATDVASLIHGSLTEGLTDVQALENPLLAELKDWRAELKPIPDFVARLSALLDRIAPPAPSIASSVPVNSASLPAS